MAGIGLVLPLAAQAEEKASAALQDSLIADIDTACANFAAHRTASVASLTASGWEIDEPTESPNLADAFGTREYKGVGSAELYLMVEIYPAHQLSYCSVNIMFSDVLFDIDRIGDADGLAGRVEPVDSGAYGAWHGNTATALRLVQAYQIGSDFHYQVTEIETTAE